MSRPPKHPPEFYRALPKVELHRHLEGSLRLETMLEVARMHDLDVPFRQPGDLRRLVQVTPGEAHNYRNFLSKFTTLRKFFLSSEILHRVTSEAILDAAADNVRYLELRFTPVALGNQCMLSLAEVIDLVIAAAGETARQAGLQVRLIASFNRHESLQQAEEVVALAADRAGDGIVGLDIAGDEANFPADPFADLLKEARRSGLRLTVHAGEWGGPENVRQAISLFQVERVGHGVRILEDPDTTALAREAGTVFEVCPTSNIHSGIFRALEKHPLRRMMDAGLATTLNTDDPGISVIQLSDEFSLATEKLGIEVAGLRKMVLTAASAAFIEGAERSALAESIGRAFDRAMEVQNGL